MNNFSTSQALIDNVVDFISIKKYNKIFSKTNNNSIFYGWGRKKSGKKAIELSKINKSKFVLMEDGFLRSINSHNNKNEKTFSIVKDDIGIYYDATIESKLENILNNYNFKSNKKLIETSKKAINLILDNNISKYNHMEDLPLYYFKNNNIKRILIIAQTANDSSLEYGLANNFSTNDIIKDAIKENPQSEIYIKIHPDVLSGIKNSDIDIDKIPNKVIILEGNYNPISLLKYFSKVYTKTSQMGFEALLTGCECICYGAPFYSNWGLTIDKVKIDRRKRNLSIEEVFAASYILYSSYYNNYNEKESDIIDVLDTIKNKKYSTTHNKAFLFGFSLWKQNYIKLFLKEYKSENIFFINGEHDLLRIAIHKGLYRESDIFIWGKKEYLEIEDFANTHNIKIKRIEDGFIRSVGLGSDLTKPYSMVVDNNGIYFDPTVPSDLEIILNNKNNFTNINDYSNFIKNKILSNKISKYNNENKKIDEDIIKTDKKKILVIGQVEDDASIKYGGMGMNNLKLLKEVKEKNKNSYIVYKSHPDVLSGNRIGKIDKKIILKYADLNIENISINDILEKVDEIHTITSLTGFEALLRGKKVFTYGIPFYSGWGLTNDKHKIERRRKNLKLEELVYSVYYLYPMYINPKNDNYCNPEILIDYIKLEKNKINKSTIYKTNLKIRNYISRKSQIIMRKMKK